MWIHSRVLGLGLLLCLLIWIFGHGINLLLAVMSGIVHGLRLNFLEGVDGLLLLPQHIVGDSFTMIKYSQWFQPGAASKAWRS